MRSSDPNRPVILVYHHLSEAEDPLLNQLGVTTHPETFRSHMRYCARHFDLIGADDLADPKGARRPLLVTFDDNYRSVLEIGGPILRELNAPSVFFLNPAVVLGQTLPLDNLLSLGAERLGLAGLLACLGLGAARVTNVADLIWELVPRLVPMEIETWKARLLQAMDTTVAEIRRASRLFLEPADVPAFAAYGIGVGNHSMSHQFFRSMTPAELGWQIRDSKRALERLSGGPVRDLSIPYGSENDATPQALGIARACGHRAAFLVNGCSNRFRRTSDVFFRLSLRDARPESLPVALHVAPLLRSARREVRRAVTRAGLPPRRPVLHACAGSAPLDASVCDPDGRDVSDRAGEQPQHAASGLGGAKLPSAAVIIVGFRNPEDIVDCLRALSHADPEPDFAVFIAENGGAEAMDRLIEAVSAAGTCRPAPVQDPGITVPSAVRQASFVLDAGAGPGRALHIAEMPDNLGYAGAINVWLRALLPAPQWRGFWILNPDTEPTPSALAELVSYSVRRDKGMVGSRIMTLSEPDIVRTRGLAWRKVVARTLAVDRRMPAAVEPDPEEVDARLDAACGASVYVTRRIIERIGLMDERYFLFFEDLEWGYRAKAVGGLGHAHRSVVPHKGGTTTGSAGKAAALSPLSVYLEFRNRILFVRDKHLSWLPWTVLAQAAHVSVFVAAGSLVNARSACRGLAAGLRGEVGRPR